MTTLNSGVIFELISPVVNKINEILTNLIPDGEIYLVALFSFVIAYALKSKNNWNNGMFILSIIFIFSTFRYIGIGN